jgi:hypothetical protein
MVEDDADGKGVAMMTMIRILALHTLFPSQNNVPHHHILPHLTVSLRLLAAALPPCSTSSFAAAHLDAATSSPFFAPSP